MMLCRKLTQGIVCVYLSMMIAASFCRVCAAAENSPAVKENEGVASDISEEMERIDSLMLLIDKRTQLISCAMERKSNVSPLPYPPSKEQLLRLFDQDTKFAEKIRTVWSNDEKRLCNLYFSFPDTNDYCNALTDFINICRPRNEIELLIKHANLCNSATDISVKNKGYENLFHLLSCFSTDDARLFYSAQEFIESSFKDTENYGSFESNVMAALQAIGTMRVPEAAPYLKKACRESYWERLDTHRDTPNWSVLHLRNSASIGLTNLPEDEAIPMLESNLKSEGVFYRALAFRLDELWRRKKGLPPLAQNAGYRYDGGESAGANTRVNIIEYPRSLYGPDGEILQRPFGDGPETTEANAFIAPQSTDVSSSDEAASTPSPQALQQLFQRGCIPTTDFFSVQKNDRQRRDNLQEAFPEDRSRMNIITDFVNQPRTQDENDVLSQYGEELLKAADGEAKWNSLRQYFKTLKQFCTDDPRLFSIAKRAIESESAVRYDAQRLAIEEALIAIGMIRTQEAEPYLEKGLREQYWMDLYKEGFMGQELDIASTHALRTDAAIGISNLPLDQAMPILKKSVMILHDSYERTFFNLDEMWRRKKGMPPLQQDNTMRGDLWFLDRNQPFIAVKFFHPKWLFGPAGIKYVQPFGEGIESRTFLSPDFSSFV